jgi:hypothetical protein
MRHLTLPRLKKTAFLRAALVAAALCLPMSGIQTAAQDTAWVYISKEKRLLDYLFNGNPQKAVFA